MYSSFFTADHSTLSPARTLPELAWVAGEGVLRDIDVGLAEGNPFTYVAAFGLGGTHGDLVALTGKYLQRVGQVDFGALAAGGHRRGPGGGEPLYLCGRLRAVH